MEGKTLEKVQKENNLGAMVHKPMDGSRQVAGAVKKADRALHDIHCYIIFIYIIFIFF